MLSEYRVFVNPSLSEVLCTTIVEVRVREYVNKTVSGRVSFLSLLLLILFSRSSLILFIIIIWLCVGELLDLCLNSDSSFSTYTTVSYFTMPAIYEDKDNQFTNKMIRFTFDTLLSTLMLSLVLYISYFIFYILYIFYI